MSNTAFGPSLKFQALYLGLTAAAMCAVRRLFNLQTRLRIAESDLPYRS